MHFFFNHHMNVLLNLFLVSIPSIMVSTECATEVSKMERIITVEYTDCAIRGKNPCLSRRIVDSKLHHLSKFNIK